MKRELAVLLCLLFFSVSCCEAQEGIAHIEKMDPYRENILLGTEVMDSTENQLLAQQVLELVNRERDKAGLKPLRLSKKLSEFASIRAKELPTKFSHTRPDGTPWYTVYGEKPNKYLGENAAAGNRTAEGVMNGWMKSPGHRSNILNPHFRELGVGYCYARESEYRYYWIQIFQS